MNIIVLLSSIGLLLGIVGSLGLALLTKVFITIQPDGTQFWGPQPGVTPEEARRQNLRLRKQQKYGIPCSYASLAVGFILQFIALWLPLVS